MSSNLLKIIGYDVLYNENVISINGAQPVKINSPCNFFMHLDKFLFFFISFPASKKRIIKYISLSFIYLCFIQIFRIASFAICLKYFSNHWDAFHINSSFIFYYPGILVLWYLFSSKSNVLDPNT